jgi:hypothetical protein
VSNYAAAEAEGKGRMIKARKKAAAAAERRVAKARWEALTAAEWLALRGCTVGWSGPVRVLVWCPS